MNRRTLEATFGRRVYEYEDPNGVVYYSFTRQESTLSNPVRLRMRSRIGTHLVNFLHNLRQTGAALAADDEVVG